MEVLPARVIDLNREPVALQYGPPGRELSLKKDPKMWRMMNRLSDPLKHVALRRSTENAEPELKQCADRGTGAFRPWEHFKCSCHKQAFRVIERHWRPGHRFWEKFSLKSTDYGFVRKIREDMRNNEIPKFPLSTVLVRWMPDVIRYDLTSLYKLLAPFGRIVSMQHVTATRVVVVFSALEESCRLLEMYRHLSRENSLYCSWWHKCMPNKLFHREQPRGLQVFYNRFIRY